MRLLCLFNVIYTPIVYTCNNNYFISSFGNFIVIVDFNKKKIDFFLVNKSFKCGRDQVVAPAVWWRFVVLYPLARWPHARLISLLLLRYYPFYWRVNPRAMPEENSNFWLRRDIILISMKDHSSVFYNFKLKRLIRITFLITEIVDCYTYLSNLNIIYHW